MEIMDYEKIIKQMIADEAISKEVAAKYFPELKESEGERIRKEIISAVNIYCSEYSRGTKVREDMLAWLEKQGEKHIDRELSNLLNRVICRFINDPNIPYSERDEVSKKIIPYVEQLEKQGKQRPNKVEPKFKVGNKIYLKPEYRMPNDDTPIANTVFEIRAIDDKHYRFDSSYIFIEDQDKYELVEQKSAWKQSDEHYELEEFAKIVRGNLTGISKTVQELFEAKYLQLTGKKMYGGFKD